MEDDKYKAKMDPHEWVLGTLALGCVVVLALLFVYIVLAAIFGWPR